MATIVRTEVRKRGIFGTIMWWLFLAYNAIMGLAFVAGMKGATDFTAKAVGQAERAGAAIGTVFGAGMVLTVWLIGALILGLVVALTRGKKVTIEKTID